MDAALARGQDIGLGMGADSVVVAGGAQVYALAMPQVSRIHLTRVHASPDGDAVLRSHRHGAIPADAVRGASGWP